MARASRFRIDIPRGGYAPAFGGTSEAPEGGAPSDPGAPRALALPLLEDAYAGNPGQPGGYRVDLFLWRFAHGRHAEALAEARRGNAPQILHGHVAVAAAATEPGLADEAVPAILAGNPGSGARIAGDLAGRHLAPEPAARIVASLDRAGLDTAAAAGSS
ncbi:hypothetical protein [Amaricoccus sp.]|uniref:hypothetical protein n=1 Tax=Amaricoccus sp. TaxID=1872485 RepID=UPI001B7AB2CB|nr:hypothetical protein [Amaricoccus sp.]MBP7001522.1 hypothetical protein [Amaricoccus sp.]